MQSVSAFSNFKTANEKMCLFCAHYLFNCSQSKLGSIGGFAFFAPHLCRVFFAQFRNFAIVSFDLFIIGSHAFLNFHSDSIGSRFILERIVGCCSKRTRGQCSLFR